MDKERIHRCSRSAARSTCGLLRKNGVRSWDEGGCRMFAMALLNVFGGELCGVCSRDADGDFPLEHYLVRLGPGCFLDSRGIQTKGQVRKRWGRQAVILPVSDKRVWQGDHWWDAGAFAEIIRALGAP